VLENNLIVIASKETLQRQKITGTITDATSGEALPGVSILIEGTTLGTITDDFGKFTLDVPSSSSVLIISFMGYNSERVEIAGRSSLDISLIADIKNLSEVVVIGYGSQKKRDIIGSVTTVNVSELKAKSGNTFEAGLQGLASGVSVQSQSGAPGAPSVIKIRGTNSINSSTDPLWIIDGVPVYSSPYGLGSSNQNPMSLINPNDIETIQILKDAAATSIYGSRASNGVIIVTTKSGKKGTGNVTFNYSSGFSQLTRTPEQVGYVNSKEWFQIMDKTYQNSFGSEFTMDDYYRFSPQAYTRISRETAENTNTNWYNEIFRTGTFNEFNLSSSQGYEKGSFFISGNYRKDKGVQQHNDLNRYSFRSNINFNPAKNLNISAKLSFSASDNERRNSGITSITTFALPWFPVYNPENPNQYFNAYTGSNPAAINDPKNRRYNVEQIRGLGVLSFEYTVSGITGLSLKSELSADVIQSNLVNWESRDIWLNGGQKPSARASEESVTFKTYNYNFFGTYTGKSGVHAYTLVTGVEGTRSAQYTRSLRGEGLIGKYQEIGNPTVMTNIYGGKNNERYLLGYFGRADYKLKDKYLFGISARQDGTSAFTSKNRWGTFFSASAGWIISEESFASFLGSNTFMKLRGSYGETGNQNVPSGLDVVNFNGTSVYGSKEILGVNGTVPVNLMVSDLTWESTKSADLGIDFGFMQNKINGSLAYYHRQVYGMLLPAPVAVSAGVGSQDLNFDRSVYDQETNRIWSNVGNMINSGVEFDIHSVNMDRNGFKWTTDFNVSFNSNVIRSLTSEADLTGKGIVNNTTVSRKGHKRFEWFVADYAGVDRVTGVPMIYALDKTKYDQTGATERLKDKSGKDSLIIGTRTNINGNRFYQKGKSADPKYYGGISNTLTYKGFELSFIVAFSGGNYILDYDRQIASVPNETRVVLKDIYTQSWEKLGDVAKYPQLRARGTYQINGVANSDFGDADVYHNRELYKGDFIRLRNVQLGYSFAPEKLKRIHLNGLRLYASASNLFTFTKYPGFDPEGAGLVYYSSAIPQLKSVIFGVDVKF
jgi:TonB-linked SusC/RagA family outer membrane protein